MEEHMEQNQERSYRTRSKTHWSIWWKLLRPHTLTASFTPVIIGTALALSDGDIHFPVFLAMLLASIIIQAATNMFNEYYDYKRGLDTAESVGIGGATVHYGVDAKIVLSLAILFFVAAVPLGIYICLNSSWWVAVVGVCCMAAGYFYTGGPYPVAYTPFGELAAGIFMGLVLILISFYIHTGTVTPVSVLVSIPISILVGGILMANNIRDLQGDKQHGRRTLAILLGHQNAVRVLAGMFIVSYGWMLGLAILNYVSPWLLLIMISIPKAVQATKLFAGKTKAIQMMPAMKATAQTHTFYGTLLTLGIFLSYWL